MSLRTKPPALLRDSAFGVLPKKELNRIASLATPVKVKAGQQLIARSSHGRECFVVVKGELAVKGDGIDARIGNGELAGELALLTGERRNASVAAATDTVVYALHPREFATLLSEAPQFRQRVVNRASARLGKKLNGLPAQILPDHERG